MQLVELLCCMAVCMYAVNAEAGNGAATDLAGFLPGIQYVYSYSSSADVYEDISLTVTAKVTIQRLNSPVGIELLLRVTDETLTWEISDGTHTDRTDPLGDLSRWFSATVGENGAISSVSLSQNEKSGVSAFKKSLVQLLVLGDAENIERSVTRSGELKVTETTTGEKNSVKVLTFDELQVLQSVVSDERLASNREDLLGYPVHSHSELILINRNTIEQDVVQRPIGLISQPILISNVMDFVPLSEMEDALSSLLTSCTVVEDTHPCVRQLAGSLKLLQSKELETFVERQLTGREIDPNEATVLIDALSYLGSGNFSGVLTQVITSDASEDLVLKILFHLTSGRLQSDRSTVHALRSIAFGDQEVTWNLHQGALLALGGIARHLRNKNEDLSNSIVESLHSALNQYSSSNTQRLRRSSDGPSHHSLQAVLIDSIGNARALQSQTLLVEHVTGSHDNLAAKHAAVKALQGYGTEESAQALLDVAERHPHPTVQHKAARAYQSHPRRTRDVSHIIDSTSHHRSRRQATSHTDGTISNVTMPAVIWRQEFGESNITVGVSRVLLNSFDIDAGVFHSQYSFSLHDETSFDTSLLLSSGEQHAEMLRTDLCLQGTATYDANILTDVAYNLTAYQFHRFSMAVPSLQQAFQDAYQRMVASENGYSGLLASIQESVNNLLSRFNLVEQMLQQFRSSLDALPSDFVLKQDAEGILLDVNTTFTNARDLAQNSVQALSEALNDLLPSRPQVLTSTLIVDRLPFIDSPFYVQYLPFAPQKALANIYSVYRRTQRSYRELEMSYEAFAMLSSPHGPNFPWLSPVIYLRTAESSISSLMDQLIEAIDTADKNPSRNYDGVSLSEFQTLRSAVIASLQPGVTALEGVGNDLFSASQRLTVAFEGSQSAFQALTQAYEGARSTVDTIFGQRFHPEFPHKLRTCDLTGDLGCGTYPTTSGDQYQPGIDVEVEPGSQILSPLSANIQLFDISTLPLSAQSLHVNYSAASSIIVFPEESSFNGVYFILSNVNPTLSLTLEQQFYQSGYPIATASNSQLFNGKSYVHVEAYKVLNDQVYAIDPTQFLQPDLDVNVSVQLECNDLVTYTGGMVVERRNVIASTEVSRMPVGEPLVQGIPRHEFPQPHDLVIESIDTIMSGNTPVQFFQSSTFIMVGQIPVQFEFSSVGNYQLNYSLSANFLSKTLQLSVIPYFHARAEGLMRVGSTVFALVESRGTLLEILLPLTLEQDFSKWPLLASSSMDIVLVPSEFNLTTQLVQRTGAGQFAEQEVLQSNTVWQYSIPPLNTDEFSYQGTLSDTTPPLFTPLAYPFAGDCFVRQLPNRNYNNPAFEIEFEAVDRQSVLNITYYVGTFLNGEDVLARTELGGKRIVVPHHLVAERELYFTIATRNLENVESFASCTLSGGVYYDRSPPLARINPIREVSSHPSQIASLVVLFDEYGFDVPQEIAIGLVPGESGADVMPWTQFDASTMNTAPSTVNDVMDHFSFGRKGRFFGDILETHTSVENVTDCATLCGDWTACLSFDYSQEQGICILHSNIEGPVETLFENIYETLSLQTSQSYFHYDKLRVGNSTVVTYTGLTFDHDKVYYINMRLRNRLGLVNVVSSSGFLVDFTPPMPGKIRNRENDTYIADGCEASPVIPGCIDYSSGRPNHWIIVDGPGSGTVFNGPVPLLDAMHTSASNYITANWNGFMDPESGIYAYTWCIGTSLGSCDVLNQTDPHAHFGLSNQQAWTNTGLASSLDLSDGSYYISVQAINNIEYGGPLVTTVQHSTPYVIDTSPPVLTEVESIEYNDLINELRLNYLAYDNSSGIASVSLALGRTQFDTSLLPWIPIDTNGTAAVTVHIPDGVETWIKLRARNNAGLLTVAVSEEAITVDRSPPLTGTVNDGGEVGTDIDYTNSINQLCVNWEGFSDPESGISSIHWAVGRTSGDSSVYEMDLHSSDVARRRACAPVSTIPNATYTSTLTVFNSAMNMQSVSVSSDGVRVDITPPNTGTVYDGLTNGADQSYSSSLTTVEAHWSGFYDYESTIAWYTITVYHQPDGTMAANAIYSTVVDGTVNQISLTQFSFMNGDQIFVEVEASNGAGMTGMVRSNGYTIDLTPPQVTYIVDGTDPSDDLEHQSDNTTYVASWHITDDESGIARIEGAIYEIREGRRMKVYPLSPLEPFVSIPTSHSSWSVRDAVVTGAKYVASIAFENGAGIRVVYETNGVIVDPTPPIVQTVSVATDTYLGGDNTDSLVTVLSDPQSIQVHWVASDPESGIHRYQVGIFDDNDTLVFGYVSFENTNGGVIEGASSVLDSEKEYRVVVIAINNAEVQSFPAYSNRFRTTIGDSAGIVMDGAPEDNDYTDEITAVTAYFIGFNSEVCGGITSYEWALGVGYEALDRESVMPFTTKGVVAGENGTGYAQVNLPDLQSFGNQQLFVTIRGITGCGGILESTSNGFVIDSDAPSLEIISTGPEAVENSRNTNMSTRGVYQIEAGYSSIWSVTDDESGLLDVTFVDIGTYPNGRDISPGVTTNNDYIRNEIRSAEGVATYVTVTVTNGAGLMSKRTSSPIVRDATPSLTGELTCKAKGYPKPIHLWQTDSQPETFGFISCNWTGFADPQSGISLYAVSIGLSPTDQSVLNREHITGKHPINSYTSPLIVFEQGSPYYVTLYITNGAGLEKIFTSDAVHFDASPPLLTGALSVLRNFGSGVYNMEDIVIESTGIESATCLYDTDTVSVVFQTPIDPESNNTFSYKLGVGFSPGNDDLLTFQPAIPTPFIGEGSISRDILHHQVHPTNFTDARRRGIYFSIQVYNCHELYSILSSNVVYIKSNLTLESSWIYDGNRSNTEAEYQVSTTEVSAHVRVGVNCPVQMARWTVENADGMLAQDYIELDTSTTEPLSNGNTFFLSSDRVTLYHDESYRVLFQGVDYTGEVFILRSNGFTVTTLALQPGQVRDGSILGQDLNYQEPTNVLWAQWLGFGDGSPEQEIEFYEVAAGSDREYPSTRTDIAPFTNVGLNNSHVFHNLNLVPESVTYFITVRAHAVSGAYVDVTSNGISVGYQQGISPGEIVLNRYQSITTKVSVYWSEFVSDVPIRLYEWALSTRRFTERDLDAFCKITDSNFTDYFEIFGFTGVHLDTTATAAGLELEHNTTYYVVIRAIDQAKKCRAVLSPNGLTVDTTEPIPNLHPRSIILGPLESRQTIPENEPYVVYVEHEQLIDVSWEDFQDDESGIASYEVGIFEQIDGCNNNTNSFIPIREFVDVGEEHEISFGKLDLQERHSYVVVVRATNQAGLKSNGYSQPIVVDSITPMAGTVKDGNSWENDVVFQSDLSMLSAVFTHAKLPVLNLSGTVDISPCPTVIIYDFQTMSPPWEALSSVRVGGHDFGRIEYRSNQVGLSTDPAGVQITAATDEGAINEDQILTGAYETTVQLSYGGTVSVDILVASGTMSLEENAVTAVTFVNSEESGVIPLFEPEIVNTNVQFPDINAFGVQIYRNQTSQSVVLWTKSTNLLSRLIFVRQDLSHINLSTIHTYSINFRVENPNTRQADLYIDGVLEATMETLPPLSDNTSIVLHVFNKLGSVPMVDPVTGLVPTVQAIFRNVHLPLRMEHLCDYGTPFFSLGSPIIEFRAGIGTLPGMVDVRDYETIEYPCLPCGNGPCADYGCESNCTDVDPYTISLTFRNLNLDDGYYSDVEQSLGSGGDLPLHLTNNNARNILSNPLTDHFQPPVYYISVEAITASGKRFLASSNGVTVDTSPPVLVAQIEQFDVDFSTEETTVFQGNNDTVSARWFFQDPQSGIVEYLWAIGSYPYGEDVQGLVSVGSATRATNSSLLGILEANTTYYVTVVAVNGAGLRSSATSEGITYVIMELNITQLELLIEIEFVEAFIFTLNGTVNEVLRTVRDNRASIMWAGVSEDIEEIFWAIRSDPEQYRDDVFPRTRVNFNDSESATIDSGVLYLDVNAFANLSEIIALADGKEEDPSDNLFFFEPGRLLYNSLEFCNFVHRCAIIGASPSILIRTKDGELTAGGESEEMLTHIQLFPPRVNRRRLPTLDKQYTVTLRTTGLEPNSKLFVGFLNQSDIMNQYRVRTPYISNPYNTMAQTSRVIARRFTEIGGPSFYVSFLGQDSLNSPLEINVTYDSSLDWTVAFPELGYWDVDAQVWREVSATCMNSSRVDETTFTITVQVCSTVLTETAARPVSLTGHQRQAMGMDPVTSSGMGSGMPEMSFIPVIDYLDRPVHFILMRIGNVSTNTAPQLLLPRDPIDTSEDTVLEGYQLEFSDNEGDFVDFYLTSLPKLGNATLTRDGLLTYKPCRNCTGLDTIEVYIIERPFGENHIPISASGQLLINITNRNDNPEVLFYTDAHSNIITLNATVTAYTEANRSAAARVASIAAFDYDGYHDDLTVFVRNGLHGMANFQIWLDAVNTPESLPLTFSDMEEIESDVDEFLGYISLVGAYITYLPNDPSFTGTDMIDIVVRDTNGRLSNTITLMVEVLPSLCQNNGICGGSDLDPNCTDINTRRTGFEDYNCSCLPGFEGAYCEIEVGTPDPTPQRDCPPGIPVVQCDGDPCSDAVCPSHRSAECRADYCGACTAKWFIGNQQVTCTANFSNICSRPQPNVIVDCSNTICDCPTPPYQCPPDSIIVETRINYCCVSYECMCPNISCPLLMECGQGVQPIPDYRGNGFPGRCCPDYSFEDINECLENSENLCSDGCVDEPTTYSCDCPEGTTLAQDGFNCGVCPHNGFEYLLGDRVKIGCNWCVCRADDLSGERWHCTSDTCDRGCIQDGSFYPVSSNIFEENLRCACEPTDVNAEWMCSIDT